MSSRLPYGIHVQTGAATFKREVEQSLAPWREMIARDDARVVRSIHCPQVPNAVDGFSPIVLYQIALRDTGKVVQVSIQGKHDPLPNPVSAWSQTRAQPRKRKGPNAASDCVQGRTTSSSHGKMAATKRRLRMLDQAQDDAQVQPDVEGQEGESCHGQYERDHSQQQQQPYYHDHHYDYEHDDQSHPLPGDEEDEEAAREPLSTNVVAHVSLHPPTPTKKPSKASSRPPAPPRYSARRSTSLAAQGLSPLYGLDDLREPDDSIRYFASTAANSEAGDSCSGETTLSNATYTRHSHNAQQRGLRRSSRLASLPPGALDEEVRQHEEQVCHTADRLAETAIQEEGEEGMEMSALYPAHGEDVDMMSSMLLDYEDEEETRLAREQIRAEAQRNISTHRDIDDEEMMSLDRWVKQEREA